MSANAIFDAIGATVNDTDLSVVDAERLCGDLCNYRLEALPHGRSAGDDFNFPAGVHVDPGAVRGPETALLDVHRNAQTHDLAGRAAFFHIDLELVPSELRKRLIQQFLVSARVEHHLVAKRG